MHTYHAALTYAPPTYAPSPNYTDGGYYTPSSTVLLTLLYQPALLPTPTSTSTPSWDQAAFLQAMNNFASQETSGTDWISDSGASSHKSASSTLLSSCTTSPFPSITLGDGSTIPIFCICQAQIPSSTKSLLLRDVLVAPTLMKNLNFVRQFTRDNLVSVEIYLFGLSVKDYLTKDEIARFNSSVIYTLFMVFLLPRLPLPWWLQWIYGISQ
jgi:hypothetical protein